MSEESPPNRRIKDYPCPGGSILAEILSDTRKLTEAISEVDGILKSHMHDHEVNQRSLENIVTSIRLEINHALKGFPNDDPLSHREYHEAKIEQIKSRAEFWKKMTFELSKMGLLGFVAWVVYSMWISFLHGPK